MLSQKTLSPVVGWCGGAATSISLIFTALHRTGFKLKLQPIFASFQLVVLHLRHRKYKLSGHFLSKTALSLFSNNLKIQQISKEEANPCAVFDYFYICKLLIVSFNSTITPLKRWQTSKICSHNVRL